MGLYTTFPGFAQHIQSIFQKKFICLGQVVNIGRVMQRADAIHVE